jgi:hypothetical protein
MKWELLVCLTTNLENNRLKTTFIGEYTADSPPVAQNITASRRTGMVLERAKDYLSWYTKEG